MASLFKRGKSWVIQYEAGSERKTLSIGRLAAASARSVCAHVEHLISAKASATAVPPATAGWLTQIDDDLHQRIAAHKLTLPRHQVTLADFAEDYKARRPDWGAGTCAQYDLATSDAEKFWGADRRLDAINRADVDALKADLTTRLSTATVRKRLRLLKHIFKAAIRSGLIMINPVDDQVVSGGNNRDRLVYVPADNALALTDELYGEVRLIVLLARFAGLRVPSEPNTLKLSDVDFERETLRVYSPKTKTSRTVPMLPVVRDELLKAFDRVPEGGEDVLQAKLKLPVIRRVVEAAITRAGLKQWPRLIQNLRASFATDCVRNLPANTAAALCGHSRNVAAEHYWSVGEDDIASAANALRNITKTPENGQKQPDEKSAQTRKNKEPYGKDRKAPVGAAGFEPA